MTINIPHVLKLKASELSLSNYQQNYLKLVFIRSLCNKTRKPQLIKPLPQVRIMTSQFNRILDNFQQSSWYIRLVKQISPPTRNGRDRRKWALYTTSEWSQDKQITLFTLLLRRKLIFNIISFVTEQGILLPSLILRVVASQAINRMSASARCLYMLSALGIIFSIRKHRIRTAIIKMIPRILTRYHCSLKSGSGKLLTKGAALYCGCPCRVACGAIAVKNWLNGEMDCVGNA